MLELISSHACHCGEQRFYRHDSKAIGLPMKFSVYLPRQACARSRRRCSTSPGSLHRRDLRDQGRRAAVRGPVRAGARDADTSPRGAGVPGETDAWDFGVGAGFYVDATQAPWSTHYRMESYVTDELRALVAAELPIDGTRLGIFGHSMGGHGALTLALRHPGLYRSVSAFAPIAAPSRCRGARRRSAAISAPIAKRGSSMTRANWSRARMPKFDEGILIDQGLADQFLANQLNPDVFEAACEKAGRR
jgi:S-formylglutathione hydrolase